MISGLVLTGLCCSVSLSLTVTVSVQATTPTCSKQRVCWSVNGIKKKRRYKWKVNRNITLLSCCKMLCIQFIVQTRFSLSPRCFYITQSDKRKLNISYKRQTVACFDWTLLLLSLPQFSTVRPAADTSSHNGTKCRFKRSHAHFSELE